ncbi:MAG: PDZ domain-containing protein [Planctomycetota bacterium]
MSNMAIKRIVLIVCVTILIFTRGIPSLGQDDFTRLHQEAIELLQAKKYEEAITAYQKILKNRPDDALALYNIACAYSLFKKYEEAVEYLQKAVEAGFSDFENIEADPDLGNIRNHSGYRKIIQSKEQIQKKAAGKRIEFLRKQYGESYTYEIDEKRKLIYASDTSEKLLDKIQEFLNKFADCERSFLFRNKPSYYITILVPSRADFIKMVPNPNIGGFYRHADKFLIVRDTGYTLRHEFTHALHFADISARKQEHSIWLTEGLATCFEESEIVNSTLSIKYNQRIDYTKSLITGKNKNYIPWQTLMTIDHKEFMQRAGECYAESRAICYWLVKTGRFKSFYDNYVDDLYTKFSKDKVSGIKVMEGLFGKRIEKVEEEWKQWIVTAQPEDKIAENKNGIFIGVGIEESVAGIIIANVSPGSPGEDAGLKAKDIILKIGSDKIADYADFINAIRKRSPGEIVTFYILREDKEQQITVKIGKIEGMLPPAIYTGAAANITSNSAVLNGSVNANGAETSVKFLYGTKDSQVGEKSVGSISGTNITNVTPVTLTSLSPFTTYYYRLTGTNTNGPANGRDMIFNTPVLPPVTSQADKIEAGGSPDIAVSPDGSKIYIVCQGEMKKSGWTGIVLKKSADKGRTFDAKINISPGNSGDSGDKPSIAVDSTGKIHVVYIRNTDYHIYYTKSTDGGATFSAPEKVDDKVKNISVGRPRIAAAGANVYVVWNDDKGRIYLDKSPVDSVNFGSDVMVNVPARGNHCEPSITVDNGGTIYVAWYGTYTGNVNQIHLATSTNQGASFLPSVRVDDNSGSAGVKHPSVAVSGNNVYVTWEDLRNANSDIRCRLSADNGANFPAPSVKVDDDKAGRNQTSAEVKVDAKGSVYVVWQDERDTAGVPEIYYAYVSTNNTQLVFSANMKISATAGQSAKGHKQPVLAIGNANLFVVWQGQITGDTAFNIYCAKNVSFTVTTK